jgi:membrane protease YdiL (CAAX protease family)
MFRFRQSGKWKSFLLGVGLYVIIVSAYFFLRQWIDFSRVVGGFTYGLRTRDMLMIFAYVAIANSFIEEAFFRGFSFLVLKHQISRPVAYMFSSIMFALYHIGMMTSWQSVPLIVLSIVGLTIGGGVFNFLDEKSDNVYLSWFVHMFANLSLNTIALIETFQII